MGYVVVGALLVFSTGWVVYKASRTRLKSQEDITETKQVLSGGARWTEPKPNSLEEKKKAADDQTPASRERSLDTDGTEKLKQDIPSFALHEPEQHNNDDGERTPTKTQPSSTSSTSYIMAPPPPPPKSSPSKTTMAPPPLPRLNPPSFSTPPLPKPRSSPSSTSSTSLRPPPSAASTLRAPPGPSPSRLTASTLPTSTLRTTSRAVTLTPGHSPLDWAALTSSPSSSPKLQGSSFTHLSRTLRPDIPHSQPPPLLRIPPSVLKLHSRRGAHRNRDAWTSYNNLVYNITPYLPFHPGGEAEILKGAGRDSARFFAEVHPWVNWEGMLGSCCVGLLVGEDDARAVRVKGMDGEGRLVVVRPEKEIGGGSGSEGDNPLDEMD